VQESTPAISRSASTPSRIAALEAAPGLLRRDSAPSSSNGPDSIHDHAWGRANAFPIVSDPVGIVDSWHGPNENSNGHAPLTPPGRSEDQVIGLSQGSDSHGPSVDWIDLPPQAVASAAAHGFSDRSEDFSTSDPFFPWNASFPTALVMIPEPGSALLLGAALAALAAARRRRPRA
jgi:hypothetical protein